MKKRVLISLLAMGSWLGGCGGDSSIENTETLSGLSKSLTSGPSKSLISEAKVIEVNSGEEEDILPENAESSPATSENFGAEEKLSEAGTDVSDVNPEDIDEVISAGTEVWAKNSSMHEGSEHVLINTKSPPITTKLTFALCSEEGDLEITSGEWDVENGIGFQIQAIGDYSKIVDADSAKLEFIIPRTALVELLPKLKEMWPEGEENPVDKDTVKAILQEIREGIEYSYAEQGRLMRNGELKLSKQGIKWTLGKDKDTQCIIASKRTDILGNHLFGPPSKNINPAVSAE